MHFVCSPFGSSGDVYPMLGLALALQARGHRVTLVGNGYFEDLIRSLSLDFVQLGTRDEFLTPGESRGTMAADEGFSVLVSRRDLASDASSISNCWRSINRQDRSLPSVTFLVLVPVLPRKNLVYRL